MNENITAKNISRRFSGIQHTILGWNVKELDDGLFVYVNPIHYESCLPVEVKSGVLYSSSHWTMSGLLTVTPSCSRMLTNSSISTMVF